MSDSEKTQSYELTFIMEEGADEAAATKKAADLTKQIEKFEGKVEKQEVWGRRDLAYPIKRNRTGVYVTMWFTLPVKNVKPLEGLFRFEESIIRSLVTKAYTVAQPGSLYPVTEEEKTEKTAGKEKDVTATPEEMLRRSTKVAKIEELEEEEMIPEEERLKKLDETLSELLKDEE